MRGHSVRKETIARAGTIHPRRKVSQRSSCCVGLTKGVGRYRSCPCAPLCSKMQDQSVDNGPIQSQDRALDQYQCSQNRCPWKLSPGTSDGNRHDTSDEEEPNRCVQELYRHEDGISFRWMLHKKSQFRRLVDSMGSNSEGSTKNCEVLRTGACTDLRNSGELSQVVSRCLMGNAISRPDTSCPREEFESSPGPIRRFEPSS